jgi:hypothetical protein
MKKIIALLLALALSLSCASVLAEAAEKTEMGTIDFGGKFVIKGTIPEGYTIVEEDKLDKVFIHAKLVKENDPMAPYLDIMVYQEDTYAPGTRLNDVDDATLKEIEESFTADADVRIEYTETGLGTKLMKVTEIGDDPDWIAFYTIYEGYEVELTIRVSELATSPELSQDIVDKAVQFLTDMDFIKAEEPAA